MKGYNVKHIQYEDCSMEVYEDTTFQDVKDHVARHYGYMNWLAVVNDTSQRSTRVMNAATDLVSQLRSVFYR